MVNISKKRLAGSKNYYSFNTAKRPRIGSSSTPLNRSVTADKKRDSGTQTVSLDLSNRLLDIHKGVGMNDVADLFAILIDLLPAFSAIQKRVLSVVIYCLLRLVNIHYERIRQILIDLRLADISTCHMWAMTVIEHRDPTIILRDGQRDRKYISFYDRYPELEQLVKMHVLEGVKDKTSSFDCLQLAKFVDETFRELYAEDLMLQD